MSHMINMSSAFVELNKCRNIDLTSIFSDETADDINKNTLTSVRLKLKRWMFNDKIYKIIRYDKEFLSDDIKDTTGLFRSVIIRDSAVRVFSPPKSINYDCFIEKYSADEVIAEEFVEGTMVNVFWDGNNWEIATRSSVGGKVSFYTMKTTLKSEYENTFRFMFLDAINYYESNEDETQFFKCLENIPKNVCLSFVLQHPLNRIVIPIQKPSLYLVEAYRIHGYTVERITISNELRTSLPSYIKYPVKYNMQDYDELKERFGGTSTDYKIVGVMLKYKDTHIRSKIRNPNYELVRELRGNQPKLQFRYLMLRQSQRVAEYLKYYPEHKDEFSNYRSIVHNFTKDLHQNYLNCYVFKQKPLKEFPYHFRTHMYSLHELYTSVLCNNDDYRERRVSLRTVVNYVNHLPPAKLMYSLNYPLYEHHTDLKKNDILNNDDIENKE